MSCNGFVSKTIEYFGKASHAAGAPEKGVNALNAASIGLSALAFQRETFKDEDHIRVHPIMTEGGDLVNVVPETVKIETLVRGKTLESIKDASLKVDRAFKAGALALGAGIEITTAPGYLPGLPSIAEQPLIDASVASHGNYKIEEFDINSHSAASTDVGDLQHVKPVLIFRTGGSRGGLHTVNFSITDEELAYIVPAKIFALTTYNLLKNNAEELLKIKNTFNKKLSEKEYIEFRDSMKTVEKEPL